jgi:hypothetical protein
MQSFLRKDLSSGGVKSPGLHKRQEFPEESDPRKKHTCPRNGRKVREVAFAVENCEAERLHFPTINNHKYHNRL